MLPKKRKRRFGIISLLLIIVLASGGALLLSRYLQKLQTAGQTGDQQQKDITASTSSARPSGDAQRQFQIKPTGADNGTRTTDQATADGMALRAVPHSASEQTGSDLAEQFTSPPGPPAELDDPAIATAELVSFYAHLDQQPYLEELRGNSPSKVYFSQLIQKMLETPPVVSGETSDLFTVLKNTAHFFRIMGRDNIGAIKNIITEERASYEDILGDFFVLSQHPDQLQNSFAISLPADALYDYAGYFLSTMGGRLYLFRRDSALRLLVSYYSILIVDKAIQNNSNRHGIDLRPFLDSLLLEMETSGAQLRFKDSYLDRLYDLKERYQ